MATSENENDVTAGQYMMLKRKEHEWSQEDLSEECGLSRTHISRIERDLCDPSIRSIEKLEEALETELFGRFMEQKRKRLKDEEKTKNASCVHDVIGYFERELAKKDIKFEDLVTILDETLKSVEEKSKGL